MFIPPHYRITDEKELVSLISKYPFGTLISTFQNEINTAGIPFISQKSEDNILNIYTHLATENPILETIRDNGEFATIILNGPNGYISPFNYTTAAKFPTWNYQMGQVNCKVKIVEEENEKWEILKNIIRTFEPQYIHYMESSIPKEVLNGLFQHFSTLKLEIISWELNYKLSQEKPREDVQSVIEHLLDSPNQVINQLGNEMIKFSLKS